MRATLARAAGLTAVLMSALNPVGLASRGGGPPAPSSPIPGAGSTASLDHTDPEYDELADLVGVAEPGGTFGGKQSGSGHVVRPRRDRHLAGPRCRAVAGRPHLPGRQGRPWTSTQVSDFSGSSIWKAPCCGTTPRTAQLSPTCSTAWAWAPRRRRTPPSTASLAYPSPAPESGSALPEPAGVRWMRSGRPQRAGLVRQCRLGDRRPRGRRPDRARRDAAAVRQRRRAGAALGGGDGYAEVLARSTRRLASRSECSGGQPTRTRWPAMVAARTEALVAGMPSG